MNELERWVAEFNIRHNIKTVYFIRNEEGRLIRVSEEEYNATR